MTAASNPSARSIQAPETRSEEPAAMDRPNTPDGMVRIAPVIVTESAGRQTLGARRPGRRRKLPPWVLRIRSRWMTLQQVASQRLPAFLRAHRAGLCTIAGSAVIHLLLLLILAVWLLPVDSSDSVISLFSPPDPDPEADNPVELLDIVQPPDLTDQDANSTIQQLLSELDRGPHSNQLESPDPEEMRLPLVAETDVTSIPFLKGDFGGRSDAGRRAAVSKFGGTADSEKAVNSGLKWLQSIQRQNGSWSFVDIGGAGQPGNLSTTDMGATALALLCFLGAGHTHQRNGEYQQVVRKGLEFLMNGAELSHAGADLRGDFEGNAGMYVQGLATICLCEAFAMCPNDGRLKDVAKAAVKFIERAQHRGGGGWRYSPGEPGDTSVAGWQIMALHSARAGGIKVNYDTIKDARDFLDSVGLKDGSQYSYMPRHPPSDSMTAVGLLCRMYLGWKRDHPGLSAGVAHLARVGPSHHDMYHNYYATQVLRHWGGDEWNRWNLVMREQLVETQIQEGPAAGSWNVTDPHGYAGGQLYQTALSILTLEVYYRHLPVYREIKEGGDVEERR